MFDTLVKQFRRLPVVSTSLLLSLLGTALVEWQFHWVHLFTFQDFIIIGGRQVHFSTLSAVLHKGEYWRLVTPVFLHFGIFHIAFNGLWLWEFGRRIEMRSGSLHVLLVMLLTGVASNLGQYLWAGPSLFGGMSGVLYGLLGYLWIRNRLRPDPILALPPGILGFMLLWLVVCMTGLVSVLMGSGIANAAHVSGLITGMALGGVFGKLR